MGPGTAGQATRTGGSLLVPLESGTPSPAEITVILRQDHRAVLGILDACAGEDNCPRLGEIGVPTVVICESKGKTTPPLTRSSWQPPSQLPG